MNQFFGTQYSQEDLQRHVAARRHSQGGVPRRNSSVAMPPPIHMQNGTEPPIMMGGDSLDDIIMQNSQDIQRRQSLPLIYGDIPAPAPERRQSIMEFGAGTDSLNTFAFGGQNPLLNQHIGQQPVADLDMGAGFPNMNPAMGLENGFSQSLPSAPLTIDTSGPFVMPQISQMSPVMMGDMMAYQGLGLHGIEDTPLSMYSANNYPNSYVSPIGPPMTPNYGIGMHQNGVLPVSGHKQSMTIPELEDEMDPIVPSIPTNMNLENQFPSGTNSIGADLTNNEPYLPTSIPKENGGSPSQQQSAARSPAYQNIYSSSGFDMLKALMRVATRSNPEIDIGAVDMSCAFVVCDVTQNDCPIIYVSEIFERLTGYTKHEVIGQNCRFLQAPDGKVTAGVARKYVDDESVHYIKTRIKSKQEAQKSLINYRKGGQPFMNLLTMIPISWDDTDEIKYYVGFQVDLVEQPSSIASKNPGGSYTVNYSQGLLPRYVWTPPDAQRPALEAGTISRDDVTAILANFNGSDGEVSRRMLDKALLENTDDVVHVLSLKGLFMYLSPSCRKVLEYDPTELVGAALSSVCHPSDIVPVTRELKDTSSGAPVSVVFRIRRKRSGYTWFESHGSLSVEQGKGRKCIILVGRERPVYALARNDIEAAGGIGENELWTKLSTSGMVLFISSSVRILLDRQPDDLIGTSIQTVMRPESKLEFGRLLERARTGKRVVYKHEIINRRGQVLQAQTTLFPGDAAEGSKPTFLVGQTRLLKPIRAGSSGVSPVTATSKSGGSGHKKDEDSPPSTKTSPNGTARDGGSTPRSATSNQARDQIVSQAGGAGLTIGVQDVALASDENIFDELKTTRCTSWQFELRQMEKSNRVLAEELATLLSNKKKRKRRKGAGPLQRDCASCHTRTTPEWRRGPSGQRDLCNSCGLRYAKQRERMSAHSGEGKDSKDGKDKISPSPSHQSSPRHRQFENLQMVKMEQRGIDGAVAGGV